ncbi:hypothetical protein FRC08_001076 [Ceratobasidium sp. 394]|nr:hypothetical protein FRC08_001076 [Ceratobasidium sp. 394]
MGKTPWTRQELDWFNAQIVPWLAARDGPRSHIPVDGIRPPDAFIASLVDSLFREFEQRRWSDETRHGFTTPQEYRADLLQKLRTLMNNRARGKVEKPHTSVPKMAKSTTARHLAMKEFNKAIRVRAAEMRAENSVIDSRTIWNHATTHVLKQMNEEDPAAITKIEQRAIAIREAASVNFAEQSEDVLLKLLELLPKRMLTTAVEWSRTTGATLYFAAMFDSKEHGLQFVDACSPDVEEYRMSKACEGFRHDFSEFVCKHLGVSMSKTPENASPQVYPDRLKDYKPCLPALDSLPNQKVELLKDLLRMYFNQLWKWQGGHGATPFKLIAEDCLTGHWSFLERHRVPEAITLLQDPSRMLAAELTMWYRYIECGQTGELPPGNSFQFARLTKADHSVVAQYSGTCNQRHPRSRLQWDGEQLLFARKIESLVNPGSTAASWNGLPVARLVKTYEPFSHRQREEISGYSSPECNLVALVGLVEEIEGLAPVHESDQPKSILNAHLPGDLNAIDIDIMFQRAWPHVSFFDEAHEDHAQYTTTTLHYWLKTSHAMRHLLSNTWLGGPAGCRWIVALIFYLVKAMTLVDQRTEAPENIAAVFSESVQQRHWRSIKSIVNWLTSEWRATCASLKTTFDARAQAWKEQVKFVMESDKMLRAGILVAGAPIVQARHYALPIELADLHECYKAITDGSPEVATRDTPQPRATPPPRGRRPVQSPSAELIELPEFGSDVSADNEASPSQESGMDRVDRGSSY